MWISLTSVFCDFQTGGRLFLWVPLGAAVIPHTPYAASARPPGGPSAGTDGTRARPPWPPRDLDLGSMASSPSVWWDSREPTWVGPPFTAGEICFTHQLGLQKLWFSFLNISFFFGYVCSFLMASCCLSTAIFTLLTFGPSFYVLCSSDLFSPCCLPACLMMLDDESVARLRLELGNPPPESVEFCSPSHRGRGRGRAGLGVWLPGPCRR